MSAMFLFTLFRIHKQDTSIASGHIMLGGGIKTTKQIMRNCVE